MTHAAEGLLQTYLDGEMESSAAAELDHHLTRCAECAAELERLRAAGARVTGALSLLDVPLREGAVEQALWRAQQGARRPGGTRLLRGALSRAAILLVAAAGVVSAALPGSPVRQVIEQWLAGGSDEASEAAGGAAPAPVVTPAPAAAPVRRAEMTVLPVDGRVRVLIWSAEAAALVQVNFVSGDRVSVQAGGEEGAVRFRSGPGRLEVYDLGAGAAIIELPRSLTQASIEVNGRQYLFKEGDQLRMPGPVAARTAGTIEFRVQ